MRRKVRVVVILAGAAMLAGLILPSLVHVERIRPTLRSEWNASLGRK